MDNSWLIIAFVLGALIHRLGSVPKSTETPTQRLKRAYKQVTEKKEEPQIIENQMDVTDVLNIDPPDLFGMRKSKELYEKQLELERMRAL